MIIEGIKNLLGEDLTKQVETTEVSFRPKSTTAPTAAKPARKTH